MSSEGEAEGFRPEARYVDEDYIEYEDFAAYLVQEPEKSSRNETIQGFWSGGRSREAIKIWAEAYDREAYEGPYQRPVKLSRFDKDRWHHICAVRADGAVRESGRL